MFKGENTEKTTFLVCESYRERNKRIDRGFMVL